MSRTSFLHPFARPAADDFTTIVRGEGARVWDDRGNTYVDALASLWYCGVGHGRAEIAEAVAAQLCTLAAFHTFDRFTNEPAERLCARLAELAPMPDARVFLTTSGSEAVDSAIKLARLSFAVGGEPERTLIVSRVGAYHGVTYGGLSAGGLPLNQAGFGPLLGGVLLVPAHDLDALAAVLREHEGRVAAVLAEPVIGAGGVHPAEPGELVGIRTLCDEAGALFVADEVICGFGRLGHWFGVQRHGVVPDLVTFAKGVTSGYQPLGGVLVGRRVAEPLEADPELVLRHGHTYSGHPASCVAAEAVLGILEGEGLLDRADVIGARLSAGLRSIDGLAEVRGEGAVWAAGLPEGLDAALVRDRMMDRGVIARHLGPSTVAFCPPLVISDGDVDRCVEALADAVRRCR